MNARQSHYVVVSSEDITKLIETVRLKQDEGWVTCGGLAVESTQMYAGHNDNGPQFQPYVQYHQAMTRVA